MQATHPKNKSRHRGTKSTRKLHVQATRTVSKGTRSHALANSTRVARSTNVVQSASPRPGAAADAVIGDPSLDSLICSANPETLPRSPADTMGLVGVDAADAAADSDEATGDEASAGDAGATSRAALLKMLAEGS